MAPDCHQSIISGILSVSRFEAKMRILCDFGKQNLQKKEQMVIFVG